MKKNNYKKYPIGTKIKILPYEYVLKKNTGDEGATTIHHDWKKCCNQLVTVTKHLKKKQVPLKDQHRLPAYLVVENEFHWFHDEIATLREKLNLL